MTLKNILEILKKILSFKKIKSRLFIHTQQQKIFINLRLKNLILKKKDKILCAKFRKGHFEGVLNVMNRLMSIVKIKRFVYG